MDIGDDNVYAVEVRRYDQPLPLDNCVLTFYIKEKRSDPDASALYPLTVQITNSNLGLAKIFIPRTVSSVLVPGILQYSLVLDDTNIDFIQTVAQGRLDVVNS